MVIDDDENDDEEEEEVVGLSLQMDPVDHFHRFPYAHVGSYVTVVRDLAQHVQDSAFLSLALLGARSANTILS